MPGRPDTASIPAAHGQRGSPRAALSGVTRSKGHRESDSVIFNTCSTSFCVSQSTTPNPKPRRPTYVPVFLNWVQSLQRHLTSKRCHSLTFRKCQSGIRRNRPGYLKPSPPLPVSAPRDFEAHHTSGESVSLQRSLEAQVGFYLCSPGVELFKLSCTSRGTLPPRVCAKGLLKKRLTSRGASAPESHELESVLLESSAAVGG